MVRPGMVKQMLQIPNNKKFPVEKLDKKVKQIKPRNDGKPDKKTKQ